MFKLGLFAEYRSMANFAGRSWKNKNVRFAVDTNRARKRTQHLPIPYTRQILRSAWRKMNPRTRPASWKELRS